jgi:hypothetical protein
VDKAVSVEAVTRELEDMARWKEQWRHKYKEAEERIERMKGEAWVRRPNKTPRTTDMKIMIIY